LTRLTRLHLDEREGWMTFTERVAYLAARYGDIIDAPTRDRLATKHVVPVEMDKAVEAGLTEARLAGYDRLDDRIVEPDLGEVYEQLKDRGVTLAEIGGAAGGLSKSSVKDAIGGKGPHTDAVAESMRRLNQKTNGQPTATLHALPTS
ncbi:MAG: hypothetical protein LCH53_05250, partial [Bacteroidetes bacterium]|nr:hypothetical protein [Bacteroidota bacterium]